MRGSQGRFSGLKTARRAYLSKGWGFDEMPVRGYHHPSIPLPAFIATPAIVPRRMGHPAWPDGALRAPRRGLVEKSSVPRLLEQYLR